LGSRRLNREEVCACFDVPPPVVHILDHATYSNITEQMRSLYRDTMAPHLAATESVLDHQLAPDFGGGLYAEFLMDEVLRGAFEARSQAYREAINAGWLQPSEVRALENLPPSPGGPRSPARVSRRSAPD
ncbi:MAG: phage portal protein, partial [Actinobacteria bacterium]|nr:phage portal protein [Actinomycetota bacterium]